MKLDNSQFWFGSEGSLRHVIDSQAKFMGRIPDESQTMDTHQSRLTSVESGVAIIRVQGSLTSTDSPWNELSGITSYNEIRNAIIEAISDDQIDKILLDVDTDGGDAKGVDDLATFIKLARKHKPIEAFISGSAFSAGYWIASAASKIYGPKMSETGSIGVISVVINRAKAMKDAGYEVTVFRGGKYKALVNPFEKLTDTAKKIYQDKLNVMEGFFLDAVSENRNIPRNKVKSQVGEGLTFFAEQSVANGLMDEVISFDDLFSRFVKQSTQNSGDRATLTEDIDMKKKVLTAESVAAIASGAAPELAEELQEEVVTSPVEDANEDTNEASAKDETPSTDAKANDGESGDTDETISEDDNTSAEDETPKAKDEDSLVTYLKEEVTQLRTDNASLKDRIHESSAVSLANESALKKIASEFIGNMSIGLGMAAMDLSGMETSAILSQYTGVKKKFSERFKVGSIASVMDDESEASSGASLSLVEQVSARANKI